MLIKKTLTSALFILSATVQADFNWQVDAAIGESTLEPENSKEFKREQLSVAGTYYLKAVEIAGNPIREAAFLGRNSKILLNYASDESTDNNDDEDELLDITADIRIGQTDFRVGGTLGSHDNGDYSGDVFELTFGWHLLENALLSFEYENESGDGGGSADISIDTFKVNYKQIINIGETWLSVGGGLYLESSELDGLIQTTTQDTATLEAFVKWYMTNQFGFGGKITDSGTDYDNPTFIKEQTSTKIAGLISYDFNELIGISAELGLGSGTNDISIGNDVDFDTSYWEIGAQMRF